MLTALSLEPANGSATLNLMGTGYQPKLIGPSWVTDGQPLEKLGESGGWDTYRPVRTMPITLKILVVGTDAADYITKRAALLAAVLPDAGANTYTKAGTLKPTFSGVAQVYADVNLLTCDAPLEIDGENSSPRSLTTTVVWECAYGYWRAVSGGAVVKV